ncbi:MBL fold metallo-hydrolase [Fibrobacter sp. UWEL]|uniref:MBL fold metallo-hydrolase n=1 Tax=Fibrobacter sp. UWEL TaxID=1896209 RepID=UPI00091551E8|nr:MBL fold metallo-hydrolase [Fibrobacter sp. UWEL]SHL40313.1 Glyoxylase, beta-lactamase superfamily II [Fibrobacter sp. UWEL]
MLFKHFAFNSFGVNCFVLSNDKGDAILIDPSVSNQRERDALATYIKDNHLTVRHLLNTHLHLDHVLGNAFVEHTYGVKAEAHQEDEFLLDLQEEQSSMYGLPFEEAAPPLGDYIAEGDTVGVEGIELQVIHVAGHSPGGVAFYLPASDETIAGVKNPGLLFSGDILFAGSMGRSDLFGGDEEALISGIKKKLLTLPAETIVLPGHGPTTTIEDERDSFASL